MTDNGGRLHDPQPVLPFPVSKKKNRPTAPRALPAAPTRQPDTRYKVLLHKGLLCALIGLAVLVSPFFIQSAALREVVAGSSLVGWFSLVLGLALVGQSLRLRHRSRQE